MPESLQEEFPETIPDIGEKTDYITGGMEVLGENTPKITQFDEIGFERQTLLTSSKGVVEEFKADKFSSQSRNTIREINPKRTRLVANEKLFDRSGAYYNNEDWYLIEGKQLHIPTGKEFSVNTGKIIKENIKLDFKSKKGILGIATDTYNLLSNWFLEEDVKDLQEAKKEEKKAKESITVKTETK